MVFAVCFARRKNETFVINNDASAYYDPQKKKLIGIFSALLLENGQSAMENMNDYINNMIRTDTDDGVIIKGVDDDGNNHATEEMIEEIKAEAYKRPWTLAVMRIGDTIYRIFLGRDGKLAHDYKSAIN